MTFEFAGWRQKAQAFILEMRIKELKQSIKHWPNSERRPLRERELAEKEEELRELQVGYH